MNKSRLLDLAYQGGIRVDSFGCPVIDNIIQLNNFADVIIKECTKAVQDNPKNKLNIEQIMQTHFEG